MAMTTTTVCGRAALTALVARRLSMLRGSGGEGERVVGSKPVFVATTRAMEGGRGATWKVCWGMSSGVVKISVATMSSGGGHGDERQMRKHTLFLGS
jgi:hypothetical protein